MSIPAQNFRRILYVVYSNQTKYVVGSLKAEFDKFPTNGVMVHYENVDDLDDLDGLPTTGDVFYILNLVNYFPETHDLDYEYTKSQIENVKLIEHLNLLTTCTDDSLLINVGINNPLFLAFNDRINDGKIDIFLQSKIEQLYVLKSSKNWINIECGFVTTEDFDDQISKNKDQTMYLNSTFNINPLSVTEMVSALVTLINKPDKYKNKNVQLISRDSKTMFSFFKSKIESPKILECVDFIEELGTYTTYTKRFKHT